MISISKFSPEELYELQFSKPYLLNTILRDSEVHLLKLAFARLMREEDYVADDPRRKPIVKQTRKYCLSMIATINKFNMDDSDIAYIKDFFNKT